jgi:signal transduction histidine kinase
MIEAALCAFEPSQYLIFSSNVPLMLYFSHAPAFFFTLACAIYVLWNGRGKLEASILFWSLIPFSMWVFFDLIVFASNRSDTVLFFWSLLVLIEPLVHGGLWYLSRVINTGRDISFGLKAFVLSLFLPLFVIIATPLGLPGFDVSYCIAVEGAYLPYSYALELFFILFIFVDSVRYYLHAVDANGRKKVFFLSLGIILFLSAFTIGNILGSITENWNFAQTGLFGAPIFAGTMVYLISRFGLFNIKVLAAQMLVVVLSASVFSLLFLRTIESVRIVTAMALCMVLVLGYVLVRNVRREVQAREEISRLAENLKIANKRLTELDSLKSQFLSIATHELRTPITIVRNFVSLLIDGTYGTVPPAAADAARQVFERATDMAHSVDTYLNVSRIEQGRIKYDFAPANLTSLVQTAFEGMRANAEKKRLTFILNVVAGAESLNTKLDAPKITEVLINLLDNSIKYTPKGSITLTIERVGSRARITVNDTGVGITEKTQKNLFKLFSPGDDSKKINPASTGVGLYISKSHIDAHKGTLVATSQGEGKGSQFVLELPIS